jgi:hypothetical protein
MGRNGGSRSGSGSSRRSNRRRPGGPKPEPTDVDGLLWTANHGSCRPESRPVYDYGLRGYVYRTVWIARDGTVCRNHERSQHDTPPPSAPRPATTPLRPTSARARKAEAAKKRAAAKKAKSAKGRRM